MPSYQEMKSKLLTLVPLFLMVACPPTVFLFWYTSTFLGGSFETLGKLFLDQGVFSTLLMIIEPVMWGSPTAWSTIGIFAGLQLLFMRVLPGKTFYGPITPKGNIPVYKANGVLAFALTIALYCLCSFEMHFFSPTLIYDNFGPILGTLNIFSLLFCVMLYFKGKYAPSSTDEGSTGNVIFDYYWGMELYPRILGWDVKMFTNCRFGMMSWGLILISFAAKQSELYGLSDSMIVAVSLQLLYISKFFLWETGYLRSLDIMHDRAGYYICWGCLVWVPGIYTSATLYLVQHPNHLGMPIALTIFLFGAACILVNFWADKQRQTVRATNGKCTVWGKIPMMTLAEYQTESGEKKSNILLASGWWGISRHFHYIPEILGAFFWSLPALFVNFIPYFYVIFLTAVLLERAFRDDKRCAEKYGRGWKNYCAQVPYKIVPYII